MVDLKDAYLHMPMLSKHKQFLYLAYDSTTYKDQGLPFGISFEPHVFTKSLKVVLALIRGDDSNPRSPG